MIEICSAEQFQTGMCRYKIPIVHESNYGIPHIQIELKYLRGMIVNIFFTIPQNDSNKGFSIDCSANDIMYEGTGEYTTHSGYCKEHKRIYVRWPVRQKFVILDTYSTIIVSESNI